MPDKWDHKDASKDLETLTLQPIESPDGFVAAPYGWVFLRGLCGCYCSKNYKHKVAFYYGEMINASM